jgi:hypothetical protein
MSVYNLKITMESKRWRFPKHRFFEWESKDEEFCRKYDIGYEEDFFEQLNIPEGTVLGVNTDVGCDNFGIRYVVTDVRILARQAIIKTGCQIGKL